MRQALTAVDNNLFYFSEDIMHDQFYFKIVRGEG